MMPEEARAFAPGTSATDQGMHAQRNGSPTSTDAARSDTREYLDACLGDGKGYLHVAVGSEPFLNAKGRYGHKHWAPLSFQWPLEADRALSLMATRAEHDDVYASPYLTRGTHRAKGAAVDHRLIHADVDDDLDIEKVRNLGGFAVGSGTGRHAHVYVRLNKSVTAVQHEALCRGLGKYLGGADSKVSDNDVLRPVGTRNFKPVVVGGIPTIVNWVVAP